MVLTADLAQPWRLIPLLNAPGSVQMALDAWLLTQHQLGLHPPTLRFYTWSPAAISLGYHQHHYPAAWHQLVWNDQPIDVVRRPSGGRAVLHHDDFTYAVITSGLSNNRIRAYQTICEFLIQGVASLGLDLHYGQAGRGYIHNPNCFGTATAADLILSDGTKLIGSAQLRRGSAILQHGSIRLNPDPTLFYQVFGHDLPPFTWPGLEASESLEARLSDALTTAARHCFHAQFEVRSLSDAEWETVLGQSKLGIGGRNEPKLDDKLGSPSHDSD